MSQAHVLIVGMTMSGKTTLAKGLAKDYATRGVDVLVLDPLNDPGWPQTRGGLITRDKRGFLHYTKQKQQCALFIDESGQEVGKYAKDMGWFATQSRHWGHRCHFITQRVQQIDPTVRGQCSSLFLFRVSKKDSEILAEEYAQDELKQAHTLEQGEFYFYNRFGSVEKGRVFKLSQNGIVKRKIV